MEGGNHSHHRNGCARAGEGVWLKHNKWKTRTRYTQHSLLFLMVVVCVSLQEQIVLNSLTHFKHTRKTFPTYSLWRLLLNSKVFSEVFLRKFKPQFSRFKNCWLIDDLHAALWNWRPSTIKRENVSTSRGIMLNDEYFFLLFFYLIPDRSN